MPRKKKRKKLSLDIDFVAPRPLEDCVYRLGRLDDRREIPFAPPVSIRLAQLDEDTWSFRLNESTPAPVTIHGYLNRLHDQSTYVSGLAKIERHRLYRDLLFGLLLILLVALVVGLVVIVLYLPVFLVFTARYQSGIEDERNRLTRLMGDILIY